MTTIPKRILITGGSGYIGRALIAMLTADGTEILVPSRQPERTQKLLPPNVSAVGYGTPWPPVDAVINLAGESIVGRWTPAKKERILQSRVDLTGRLVTWLKIIHPRPTAFLSMSAVGIYGDRPGERLTENSPLDPQQKFRYQVCRAWEETAQEAEALGLRVVLLRVGNVLDTAGGYLGALLPLYRFLPIMGLGRPESMFSWISHRDTARLIHYALKEEQINGPLNLTAPHPVPQGAFTRLLAARMGKPVRGRLPEALLQLGLGEFSAALLDSQAAYPEKALAHGFQFLDADIVQALNHWFPE